MLLLHLCCAPCALPIVEYLTKEKGRKDLILYFFNPNIYPKEEYEKRLKETEKLARMHNLKVLTENYNHKEWINYLKKSLKEKLEFYPENSERCLVCFSFRLEKTAELARRLGFEEFATTLSVNRFKNTEFINKYCQDLADKNKVRYLIFEGKPEIFYRKGFELSKKYNLYRQKYCGCEFSLK